MSTLCCCQRPSCQHHLSPEAAAGWRRRRRSTEGSWSHCGSSTAITCCLPCWGLREVPVAETCHGFLKCSPTCLLLHLCLRLIPLRCRISEGRRTQSPAYQLRGLLAGCRHNPQGLTLLRQSPAAGHNMAQAVKSPQRGPASCCFGASFQNDSREVTICSIKIRLLRQGTFR